MMTQLQPISIAHSAPGARLDDVFNIQAKQNPDATAVEFQKRSLTYAELKKAADILAADLQQMGIRPGTIVGLYAERSLEMIVAMIGILKSGAAYLPLDPGYPADRIQLMLDETEAPVVLLTPGLQKRLPANAAQTVTICLDQLLTRNPKELSPTTSPSDIAYVIYTSGSTGKPKGVMVEHRSVVSYARAASCEYGIGPGERLLQFSSISFDASVEEIFGALCSGATLVLRTDEMITSAEVFLQECDALGITILDVPTAFWHELAVYIEEMRLKVPRSLRTVITGGEQALAGRLKLWQKHCPTVQFINTYGPTETTVAATFYRVPQRWQNDYIPIGYALPGWSLHVLDSNLQPIQSGEEGELYIGGVGVARGYLKRPELTAERFISYRGERLYKTGDLVRALPEGSLQFLGRIDHQVKIRGFRIELEEIETVLNRHPKVRQSLVIAWEESPGDKQLVAYATLNSPIPPEQLRQFVAETLPGYMVPARYIILETFPITPNGKIDRKNLPNPSDVETVRSGPQAPPRTVLEMKLQLIFARFFNQPDVGVKTSFFELGGDSLQALKMIVEIEGVTRRKLPLGILYRSSTVEELARTLEQEAAPSQASALVPLQTKGSRPPLFLIHTTPGDLLGYGNLVYHLGDEQPCYGFQSRGLDSIDDAHTSIEGMASYYIALMRTVQPRGPYQLGGWCYGGIVAVEMAHQLHAVGEEVSLLALIETPAPAPGLRHPRYYFDRLNCALKMSPAQCRSYLRAKKKYQQEAKIGNELRYKRVEQNGSGSDAEITRQNLLFEKLERLYSVNMDAVNRYKSRPYPGKVLLFNAEQRNPAMIPDLLYGWRTLAEEIEAHHVPGDHDSVLMEPNVRVLAAKLGGCISKSVVAVTSLASTAQENTRNWALSLFQTGTSAIGVEFTAVESIACSTLHSTAFVL
jgi:amino acid adenylation domain-containing protein